MTREQKIAELEAEIATCELRLQQLRGELGVLLLSADQIGVVRQHESLDFMKQHKHNSRR